MKPNLSERVQLLTSASGNAAVSRASQLAHAAEDVREVDNRLCVVSGS